MAGVAAEALRRMSTAARTRLANRFRAGLLNIAVSAWPAPLGDDSWASFSLVGLPIKDGRRSPRPLAVVSEIPGVMIGDWTIGENDRVGFEVGSDSSSSDIRGPMTVDAHSFARRLACERAVFDRLIELLPCFATPTPAAVHQRTGGIARARLLMSSITSASHFWPLWCAYAHRSEANHVETATNPNELKPVKTVVMIVVMRSYKKLSQSDP
jgi:hypothetical protein